MNRHRNPDWTEIVPLTFGPGLTVHPLNMVYVVFASRKVAVAGSDAEPQKCAPAEIFSDLTSGALCPQYNLTELGSELVSLLRDIKVRSSL